MLILWKGNNISLRTLLVCWKSRLCWSHNSYWLPWDQEITADLWQCETKIRLQDIVWNLTNQNQTTSLRPGYKQMCSFFSVLHGNAKCQLLCTQPFGQASIQNFSFRVEQVHWEGNQLFSSWKNTMSSCNLPTCNLDKITDKLKVTVDVKQASANCLCKMTV